MFLGKPLVALLLHCSVSCVMENASRLSQNSKQVGTKTELLITDTGVTALKGVGLCRCDLCSLITLGLTVKTIKETCSDLAVS